MTATTLVNTIVRRLDHQSGMAGITNGLTNSYTDMVAKVAMKTTKSL